MITTALRLAVALRRILPVLLLLATALTAKAQVGFSLLPPSSVAQGHSDVLTGQLTNSGPDTVYFNGLSYQFLATPAGAVTDPNDPDVALSLYFDNAAPFFLAGTSDPMNPTPSNGPLFDVFAASDAALGNYDLRITLRGGPNGLSSASPSDDALASFDIRQTVTPAIAPIPELSTGIGFGLMVGLGLCSIYCSRRRAYLPV